MAHASIEMYNFNVWANKTMLDRLKEIPQDIYNKEIQSVFPSISKAMPHIYITDICWLNILLGKSMSDALVYANQLKENTEAKSLEELEMLFLESSEQFKAIFNQQDNMEKTIVVDNPYAGIRETSYSEIVLQIVNHATYHRGNITAMLRQLGYASTMTEYALYWYSR
ncbi:DinB family protein [Paenibacillus radicis (ex Xue et al. 2023)]|uniref:Damage-inducible protein DinB n=1 Tax=Paenibacillus radicis (ex Xue et al. 2023) TaxID=2972489 RepID=A0ABT1YQ83_9BACL|nr:DinB family protein [Paenibacillus radicis (ex Xue et al. 2023)]MCR8635187.1 damage-inducible protein DinB [Paenibacillus radicis (ex Xue et al. 2023)]